MNVIDWLLDADPPIRWQVMRDLADAAGNGVASERARVAREGWRAQLLAAQDPDGRRGGGIGDRHADVTMRAFRALRWAGRWGPSAERP